MSIKKTNIGTIYFESDFVLIRIKFSIVFHMRYLLNSNYSQINTQLRFIKIELPLPPPQPLLLSDLTLNAGDTAWILKILFPEAINYWFFYRVELTQFNSPFVKPESYFGSSSTFKIRQILCTRLKSQIDFTYDRSETLLLNYLLKGYLDFIEDSIHITYTVFSTSSSLTVNWRAQNLSLLHLIYNSSYISIVLEKSSDAFDNTYFYPSFDGIPQFDTTYRNNK